MFSANLWGTSTLARLAVSVFLLLATFCSLQGIVLAQSSATGGQITGQVLDSTGAALGGAEVTVRNLNTNYTREAVTNDAGLYVVPLLPAGPYEVMVKLNGFAAASQDILVTLGSSVNASFNLTVAETSEVIEVNGANSSDLNLEPSRSSAQQIINDLQIRDLPANGRRFQDFVLLTPAVSVEPSRNGLSVSGQRGINININIDGADYNQPFFGGIRGGERSGFSPTVSQEAVQEFQVARNTFSAEFGRSTGGVVNVITKSGTNEFHGSAFYLIRDEVLTAPDAFQRQGLARQQQVGGSFGGPIVKNRTFFFTALDFQKVNQPVRVLFSSLDAQNVRNTPGAQALIGVAPEEQFSTTNDSQVVLGRIDHQLLKNNNLSARFNFSNNKADNATTVGDLLQATTTNALSNNGTERDRTYTAVTQLTSIISSRLLNELRFQFAREERPRKNNGPGPEVTVRNLGVNLGVYGRRSFLPVEQFDDRYQVTDNVSLVAGKHTLKIGGDFNRAFVDQIFRSDAGGVYRFDSLTDFLARRPAQFRQFGGTGVFQAAQKELALYIQDEWRPRAGLTINAGFRYEATFNPDELPATTPQFKAKQAKGIPDQTGDQFGPRLGLAWDVANKGKTIVRVGSGLFYGRTPLLLYNQAITNNGGNLDVGFSVTLNGTATITNAFKAAGIDITKSSLGALPTFTPAQFQQLFASPSNGALSVNFFDPNFQNPRSVQFNAGVDHQLQPGVVVGADFAYINTTRLERLLDVNLGTPVIDATGRRIFSNPRPDPRFFSIRSQESSSRSLYRAVTLSINIRKQKYVFDTYYTISTNYSDDDNERNFAGLQYSDPFNLSNEYNYSNLDQRHQVTMNGLYNLPLGFEISGTARFTSGTPYSAGAGADTNRDGTVNERPIINGKEFKRNSFRNFSFSDISLRLQKGFKVPNERGRILLSLEMFNLLNFDNVLVTANRTFGPGTVIQNGRPVTVAPLATFGQIRDNTGNYFKNNSAGSPFQAQVGVRYIF